MKKQESSPASNKYKLRGEEFDEVAIINSKDKEDVIRQLKEYASKHEIVDYQFTSNLYVADFAYYYYSVIIFYNKRGGSTEVTEQPTKETPTEIEEIE